MNWAKPLQAITATSRPTPFVCDSARNDVTGFADRHSKRAPLPGRQRLGQHEPAVQQVEQRERAGGKERQVQVDRTEQAADHRPEDEAETEHRTSKPKRLARPSGGVMSAT